MNKDQVAGRIKEVSGKIQKNVADAMDNESAQAEGTEKEIAGKVQKNLGDAKNKVADAIDR
jgi:uncharacterized protein YjbJ (UPF0337 family)